MSCSCTTGSLSNTGSENCKPINKVVKGLILVNQYDSNGDLNQIDLTDTLDSAFFTDLINNTDPTARWFPLNNIKNVDNAIADNVTKEYGDGSKYEIRDGIRSTTFIIPEGSFRLNESLKSVGCIPVAAYLVTADKSIIGMSDADGFLRPIRIENGTFKTKLHLAKDDAPQEIEVMFDWAIDESDENLHMIIESDLAVGVNPLLFKGLIDATFLVTNDTQTGFTLTIKTTEGSAINPVLAKGWVAADITLYNDTDAAAVTGHTMVETSTKGVYTVTHTSQTSGDDMIVSKAAGKKGYEVPDKTWTI